LATRAVTNAPRLHKSGSCTSPSRGEFWFPRQPSEPVQMTSFFHPLETSVPGKLVLSDDFF